jgi:SAM-dependent methyltransferase
MWSVKEGYLHDSWSQECLCFFRGIALYGALIGVVLNNGVNTSIIYRFSWLYEAVMMALYWGNYKERSKALATLIPEGASVLDVCCGPASLYFDYLQFKRVAYTGLDINDRFVQSVCARGVKALVWDVSSDTPLPKADYVIMQASLYHFLPDPRPVVDRMLEAAGKNVLLTEPVRNLADSPNPLLAWLARKLTNPGTGDQPRRFNAKRFEEFLGPYRAAGRMVDSHPIAAGREQLCVLRGG